MKSAGKRRAATDTETLIGKDEMFAVRRSVRRRDLAEMTIAEIDQLLSSFSTDALNASFDETLAADLDLWTARLLQLGWPSPGRLVLVDGELWTELSPDDPQIPLEIATGRVEHGCDFILTRVKPLSEAWWLARLSCFSLMILEETDSERRIFMAVKLGEARRMAISHRIHLSDLSYGRVARRQRIEGGRQRKKQSDEIVSRMASLVKQGTSISTAALIVYKKHKFGTSESANERLYFRTRKKRRHS